VGGAPGGEVGEQALGAPDGSFVFTGLGPAEQPFGATAICAVVATNTHEVDQIEIAELTKTCTPTP
jgi:hypothetical protein